MNTTKLPGWIRALTACLLIATPSTGCSLNLNLEMAPKPTMTAVVQLSPTPIPPSPTPANTSTPTPRPTATVVPTPLPVGKIRIIADPAQYDWLVNSGVIENFEKKFPGIQLEWSVPVGIATSQAGSPASTPQPGSWDVAIVEDEQLAGFLAGGLAADISRLASGTVANALAYKQRLVRQGSGVFALPLDAQPAVLYYRRDIFERAGLASSPDQVASFLSTWDDYLSICRQIKQKTGLYCFANTRGYNSGRLFQVLAWQSGGNFVDPSGRVVLNSPELVVDLDLLGRFWREKLVADEVEWSSDWVNLLADPKSPVATEIGSSQFAEDLKIWVAPDLAGQWGIVPIPSVQPGSPRAAGMGGKNLVMAANTQNPEAAWAFMQFAASGDQVKLFTRSASIPAVRMAGDSQDGKPDPYFGGQDLTALFESIGMEIPETGVLSLSWQQANPALLKAIRQVAAGVSAQAALNSAQTGITATPASK